MENPVYTFLTKKATLRSKLIQYWHFCTRVGLSVPIIVPALLHDLKSQEWVESEQHTFMRFTDIRFFCVLELTIVKRTYLLHQE